MLKINLQKNHASKYFLCITLQFFISFSVCADSFSVRCKFSDGQVTDFDKLKPNTKRANDMSELVFDQIDLKKNTARLIGNQGVETIKAIQGYESVHLIELTGFGNMNTTTLFLYKENKNSNLIPVVHSRHVMTPTGPLPSQYLGICTKLI